MAGKSMSGVTVATMIASISSGRSPRLAISRRTASAPILEVVSPGAPDPALPDAGPGDDPVVGGLESVASSALVRMRSGTYVATAEMAARVGVGRGRRACPNLIPRTGNGARTRRGHERLYFPAMPSLNRRRTVTAAIGGVPVGSDHPIVVQSMTNTDTADVMATVRQAADLARAGSELVRVTVNNEASAAAVPDIVEGLERQGITVPIIGDFHYNGHLLLTRYPGCARALAKYRINPGNVGGKRHDENFRAIIEVALAHDKPVRIGVNWGSLDQSLLTQMMDANALRPAPRDARDVVMEAMVESALQSAALAEATGMGHDRIVLSAKVSGVQDLVEVYRLLAARCDYPLHLGLTEAGLGSKGIIASTAGLSILLQEGIGDTIRVSLTPAPGGDRTEEVRVAQQVLQSLGLRSFTPQVTSCPGCGRTTSTFFQQMAQEIQDYLREKMPVWRSERPGVEDMKVAVMGCVVNGPGESKHADIGISLPGTAEEPKAPVYVDGRLWSPSRRRHRGRIPGHPGRLCGVTLRRRASRRRGPEPCRSCRSGQGLEATLRDQPLAAIVVLFGAGLATSLTPCVYPMIPITAGILGGAGSARRSRAPPSAPDRGLRPGPGAGVLLTRTPRGPVRHPVWHRQLQPLGPVRHGQPAPGVRTGPAGRLYRECPGPACGLGRSPGWRLRWWSLRARAPPRASWQRRAERRRSPRC